MSNEVMRVDPNQVPAFLRRGEAPKHVVEAQAGDTMTQLSIRGSKFRVVRSDGSETPLRDPEIQIIILESSPEGALLERAYFDKGYVEGKDFVPACASSNGVFPDQWESNPIAKACSDCPKNVFGTKVDAQTGETRKGKACAESKRLFILLPKYTQDEILSLRVPVTSLSALSQYGKSIAALGIEPFGVITTLRFTMATYPQLEFLAERFIDNEQQYQFLERLASSTEIVSRIARMPDVAPAQEAPAREAQEAPAREAQEAPAREAQVREAPAREAQTQETAAPSSPQQYPLRNEAGQIVDKAGAVWDPKIHATGADGGPVYTANDLFRKRRGRPKKSQAEQAPVEQAPVEQAPVEQAPAEGEASAQTPNPMRSLDDVMSRWG